MSDCSDEPAALAVEPVFEPQPYFGEHGRKLMLVREYAHRERVRPVPAAHLVLDCSVNNTGLDALDIRPRRDLAEVPRARARLPRERKRLDQDDVCMATARLEESAPLLGFDAQEVAREERRVEAAAEIKALDPRMHDLRAANVLEHVRRLVDGSDAEVAPHELARYPSGATPELEDRCSLPHRAGHKLAFTALGEQRVELDGAAVGSNGHARNLA